MRLFVAALVALLTLLPPVALASEPKTKVSVDLVNVPLSQAVSTVCRQARLGFVLDPSESKRIALVVKDLPLLEALDLIGRASGWQYFYSDGMIFMGPPSARAMLEAYPDAYCMPLVPDWRPH